MPYQFQGQLFHDVPRKDPIFYLAIRTVGPLLEEQEAFRKAEVGFSTPRKLKLKHLRNEVVCL